MNWRTFGVGLRIGGHRGARAEAPENTIAGFELARAAGVDYVETDVQRAVDGALVLFHDETLERTTDGRGPVADHALAGLLRLDAGAWFGAGFAGERIPTLDAFLAWVEARWPLGAVIEAKAEETGAEIAGRIARRSGREHLAICSFLPGELRAAKTAWPEAPCILLLDRDEPPVEDPVELTRACGASGAGIPWEWLTAAILERMHAAGLAVGAGTANDAPTVERVAAMGVDFVDSDRPAAAVVARDAWNARR